MQNWCFLPCTFSCACPFLSPVPHSPQPLQTFPSHHPLWCSQNCHSAAAGTFRNYKWSPLTLWMLHLRGCGWVQAEHALTHTLIWGVFGTQKEHLLWQWTSAPEGQEQKICKWQVWKGFWLKDKTKHTSTESESLNTLMWWPPWLVPTAVPQKIPESGTAHFTALQYQLIRPSEPPQIVL